MIGEQQIMTIMAHEHGHGATILISHHEDSSTVWQSIQQQQCAHVEWQPTIVALARQKTLNKETLQQIANILEQDSTTPWYVLVEFISQYPKELGFSVLLAAMRYFLPRSDQKIRGIVMELIFNTIERYYESFIHCIEKMDVDDKQIYHHSPNTVIGEALILSWDRNNKAADSITDAGDTISNNLAVAKEIFQMTFQRFPKSILYRGPVLSPIHGACTHHPFNIELFKLFIEQHLQIDPSQRGGLYNSQYGQTPIECLIETNKNVTPLLKYLRDCPSSPSASPIPSPSHISLLRPQDVTDYALLHKAISVSDHAPIEAIQFLLELNPQSILARDACNESTLDHFYFSHIAFRDSEMLLQETLEVLKLLLVAGIKFEREQQQQQQQQRRQSSSSAQLSAPEQQSSVTTTIGGLFTPQDPFLSAFIEGSGIDNHDAVRLIRYCLQEFQYHEAPVIHAAINNANTSTDHLKCLIDIFGASSKDDQGSLPLHFALNRGLTWSSGIEDIVAAYPRAVMTMEEGTGLPPFAHAAVGRGSDLDTIFGLLGCYDHGALSAAMLSKKVAPTPVDANVDVDAPVSTNTIQRQDQQSAIRARAAGADSSHCDLKRRSTVVDLIGYHWTPKKRTKML